MKLTSYVVISSFILSCAVLAAAEDWGVPVLEAQDSSAAAPTISLSDLSPVVLPEGSTPAPAAPTGPEDVLKLNDEASGHGYSLSPVARESMQKITAAVSEINAAQQSIYQKIMGVDAETDTFFSAFSDKRGKLAAVADSVDDYLTAQDSNASTKGTPEERQKRADLLNRAITELKAFRDSLKDLSLQDKVLDQQDDDLRTLLAKSLEALNEAVKRSSEAQKHRNALFDATTDDAAHMAEIEIGKVWSFVETNLKQFKDSTAKEIDTKIQAIHDGITKMNVSLDATQKSGESLKDLIKSLGVQEALIATSDERAAVSDVNNKLDAVKEGQVALVTAKESAKESSSWLGWGKDKMSSAVHSVKDFGSSLWHKKAAEKPAATTASASAGGQAQALSQPTTPAVVPVPVVAPVFVVPPAAPVASLSPNQNPARAEDMKQVKTVGRALGESVNRAVRAVGAFFRDLKNGLFEPTDTSDDDARPVAAKSVTLPTSAAPTGPIAPEAQAPVPAPAG